MLLLSGTYELILERDLFCTAFKYNIPITLSITLLHFEGTVFQSAQLIDLSGD